MNPQDLRVLVVEDEADMAAIVSKVLNFNRVAFVVAKNGVECLAAIPQFEPNVVLMDLRMPQMDGWETLSAIRANPHTAYLKVVALTAFGSDLVYNEVQRVGFDGYMDKPINAKTFLQDLVEVLGVG
jgi:CheY-like chemotaxis protein